MFNTTSPLLLTVIFIFLTSFTSSSATSACNKYDHKALLTFQNSFPSNSFPSWTNSTDCCTWNAVGCDSATGRVTSLSFDAASDLNNQEFHLVGSIPSSLGDLSALETITFASLPSLVGPIPPQLSKLKRLRSLIIYNTGVSGPVPSILSNLTSLQELRLPTNKLSGTIPSSLGNLVDLNYVDLSDNRLTGNIPSSLFSHSKDKLPTLILTRNKLSGKIPSSFGNVGFYNVDLSRNQLTGDASFLFGKSKDLSQISLGFNRLSFDLSKVEYPTKSLGYMDISHNRIYGSISNQITEVTKLGYLDVSYNNLCGKIPNGGQVQTFRQDFFSHNKCLCGPPLLPCK